MIKKMLLCCLLFPAGLFATDGILKELLRPFTDSLFFLRHVKNGPSNLPFKDDPLTYNNGKYFVSLGLLKLSAVANCAAVVKTVDENKTIDLRRYQPTHKQVAFFMHDVLSDTIATEVAKTIVRKTTDGLTADERKKYALNPKEIALRLAREVIKEGLYQLVCAEVHKHQELKAIQSWFPKGSDDCGANSTTKGKHYATLFVTHLILESALSACGLHEQK